MYAAIAGLRTHMQNLNVIGNNVDGGNHLCVGHIDDKRLVRVHSQDIGGPLCLGPDHMTGAMYAAIAGLRTHMQNLNVIGNNVANVNTYGYKAARSVFRTSIYTTLTAATPTHRKPYTTLPLPSAR